MYIRIRNKNQGKTITISTLFYVQLVFLCDLAVLFFHNFLFLTQETKISTIVSKYRQIKAV